MAGHKVALAAALLLPLAGCLDGPLSVDPPGTGGARNPDLPGLLLFATITKADDGLRMDATLSNDGTRTFQASSVCVSPWATHLKDDRGRTLTLQGPQVACLAFGLAPIPPGAKLSHNWTWDGNVWDGDDGPRRAPPGLYMWHVTFDAYTGSTMQEPGEARTLSTGIQVRMG
jgi:hypothetical protein